MINWRKIEEVGYPLDDNKTYLTTDGREISTSDIIVRYSCEDGVMTQKFIRWRGDENTYEDNSCFSGELYFHLRPTHWCPTDEIELPEK